MEAKKNNHLIITKDTIDSYGSVERASASYNIGRTFLNTDTNVSVRSEYTRSDYNYYRNYETTSRNSYENIGMSLRAYDKVGIVRNVIDLMSDFVCKGIRLVHPVASQERFYKEWFKYVDGPSVSERFTNYLYRIANVPVNITYGKVPVKTSKKWSSANGDIEIGEPVVEKKRVPLRYSFINPLNIEVLSPELTLFTGKPFYALRVSHSIVGAMKRVQDAYIDSDEDVMQSIPSYIIEAINDGKNVIPLTGDNLKIYFYRKDDWKVWADSMIVPIMDDLMELDKMKLADVSALDGIISSVRLWTVGYIGDSPNNSLIPTTAMINKVRNILANNVGGGVIDMVWGPELQVKEISTQAHNFLGKAKYEPVLSNIYEGLGVPFASESAGKGMTNNFVQMQTFIERLQYGRRILTSFWEEEIKKVQKAMGYTKPARVTFDKVNLGDESSYKNILLSLLDRDIVSVDTVLNDFGYFSDLERIKIRKEYNMRQSNKMPDKASPYHNPQTEEDLKKLLLQRGGVAPSELGLELLPKKEGEKSAVEQTNEHQMKIAEMTADKLAQRKYDPSAPNGRPKGKKDQTKRKLKAPPLRTKGFINTFLWGYKAQEQISDLITPILLSFYKKPNVRSLTTEQFNKLEATKLLVFSNMKPFDEIEMGVVQNLINSHKAINCDVEYATKALLVSFVQQNGRQPTVDEMRQIQASGFAVAYDEENSENS